MAIQARRGFYRQDPTHKSLFERTAIHAAEASEPKAIGTAAESDP